VKDDFAVFWGKHCQRGEEGKRKKFSTLARVAIVQADNEDEMKRTSDAGGAVQQGLGSKSGSDSKDVGAEEIWGASG